MWTDSKTDELATEFEELIQKEDAAIFLFVMEGKSIGFAQCQLRYDYVEGTDSSPVEDQPSQTYAQSEASRNP